MSRKSRAEKEKEQEDFLKAQRQGGGVAVAPPRESVATQEPEPPINPADLTWRRVERLTPVRVQALLSSLTDKQAAAAKVIPLGKYTNEVYIVFYPVEVE